MALFGHLMAAFALFLLAFPILCSCRECGSAFCGNLNISFPFRLKHQPHDCGDHRFELECENNNRTTLVLRPGSKVYVQQISYENTTIRVVDASLDTDDCNSLPLSPIYFDYYYKDDKYSWSFISYYYHLYSYSHDYVHPRPRGSEASVIFVVNCTKPMKSPLYVDASRCTDKSNTSSLVPTSYLYFLDAKTPPYDLNQSCTIEVKVPIMVNNISGMTTLDIYNKLSQGFFLVWDDGCDVFRYPQYCVYTTVVQEVLDTLHRGLGRYWKSFEHFFYRRPPTGNMYRKTYDHFVEATVGLILLRYFLGILCLLVLVIYKWRRRHLAADDKIEEFLRNHNLAPIRYSFKEIKEMTRSFKEKLGEGGYGSVFKGKLRSRHYVAIKLLGKSKGNGQDFINEVASIGRIHHTNVAKLVGFCVEGSKQALVYDFMSNGSLDKIIFSEENKISLGWKKMFDIVVGVAQGIDYLHQGCDMQILHFDIKPHNILLDENFNPKVSDFGLAKLYSVDDSIVSLTAARGTIGYIASELVYKNLGGISYKADVYSFGMLLMEMVGRRKNVNAFAEHTSQIYYPSWIYDQLDQGEDIELGDISDAEKVMVKKMVIVAFWCIQLMPADRPSMSKVLKMLETDIELLDMPPKPFYQLPLETSVEVNGCESFNDETSTSSDAVPINSSNVV